MYQVADHPKLSPMARAFSEPQLTEEAAIAADLLELGDVESQLTEEEKARATRAVVLQVNHQADHPDIGAVSREKKGDQEVHYRDADVALVHPTARMLASTVLARFRTGAGASDPTWATLRSLR